MSRASVVGLQPAVVSSASISLNPPRRLAMSPPGSGSPSNAVTIPINPRCYQAVIVPTFIITLNWADVVSQAHNLDAQLKQIEAKSSEGFHFAIDLQVQIHIPDTQAPYVISMVGSVANLVNEVLQAAVGNHFRNKLQSMPAVSFIATREAVQQGAFEYVKEELAKYGSRHAASYPGRRCCRSNWWRC